MTMTEDNGFKCLLGKYPTEALELFSPEVIAERGPPQSALLIATEIPPLAADSTHRLMDLAVRFTWSTGSDVVILLIEHWSQRARIDLPRVLRYTAELTIRNPGICVLPVLLLTDDSSSPYTASLVHAAGPWEALRFTPRVVH